MFTALSQGRRSLLLGDWLKGWDTLHHFLSLELALCLPSPLPHLPAWEWSSPHTGQVQLQLQVRRKCGLAITTNQIIDPRGKGKLNETESKCTEAAGLHLLWFISVGEVLQRPAANETMLQPFRTLRWERAGSERFSPHAHTSHLINQHRHLSQGSLGQRTIATPPQPHLPQS